MAVFTHLTKDQIENFLASTDTGTLLNYEGIAQGIDNTNYKIQTSSGKFILTVFESRIDPNDLPFFLDFMSHLSQNGITCPKSIYLSTIAGKPAALFTFLEGRDVQPDDITPTLCAEIGTLLAKMHIAGETFPLTRINSMGLDAWEARLKKVGTAAAPFLGEINHIKNNWPTDLPKGAIHADIFPDNVFIKDGHILGVIDFYFSATDFLAYDLAIVMNAWCFDGQDFNLDKWNALLSNYQSLRPLTDAEKDAYQVLSRGAAMRFLSSRLHDLTFHDPKALVTPKPPAEYIQKLEFHKHAKFF